VAALRATPAPRRGEAPSGRPGKAPGKTPGSAPGSRNTAPPQHPLGRHRRSLGLLAPSFQDPAPTGRRGLGGSHVPWEHRGQDATLRAVNQYIPVNPSWWGWMHGPSAASPGAQGQGTSSFGSQPGASDFPGGLRMGFPALSTHRCLPQLGPRWSQAARS